MICALAGSSLVSSPLPLAAAAEGAELSSDRVDALVASVALYPDPLLAKLLIAATYPLEVDRAERWLRQHKSLTGAALDRAIAGQSWDDSVKDLARVPAVLSMMDDRLAWTQNLGDTFLAQPSDVFASVQRLRGMALKAHKLHSTSQQKVTATRQQIIIEPAVAQVIEVPFYDPQVAFGDWPHSMYPPMWWTAPRGYTYASGVGFMTGIGVPAAFWNDTVDWNSGAVLVRNAVGTGNDKRLTWTHDPKHRQFVSYSTPQLRHLYGRDFDSVAVAKWDFRGYDQKQEPLGAGRPVETRGGSRPVHEASDNKDSKPRPSAFEDMEHGAAERLFSMRGNASIATARRDNSHFPIGELVATTFETNTVAAR